jgi:hypothetical protein
LFIIVVKEGDMSNDVDSKKAVKKKAGKKKTSKKTSSKKTGKKAVKKSVRKESSRIVDKLESRPTTGIRVIDDDGYDADLSRHEMIKRELLEERLMTLSDEVITADALSKFPDLDGLNDRDMLIMMGTAHGFSLRRIAKAVCLSPARVGHIVKRIDPDGRYRLDSNSMRAFIAKRMRAKVAIASANMTDEKISEMGALDSARFAKMASEVAALQERPTNQFGDSRIKKVIVEFQDEGFDPNAVDGLPIAEVVEEGELY